ncbi:hypothetical protein BH582_12310 [Vibrio sp. 10N.222.47.A9]|uniref:hypothetical protein n=1 Tax=Vibrio sp. 10N.222.47.A9 TaxID=1903178 RepID=UPI000976B18E|nr:hypothetical protein [Vibrio sp. 10N.222.47.A9]OMO31724.1 hypothetical protein BH582_12310 [Vibrio sp. 10N.222.47.A9]
MILKLLLKGRWWIILFTSVSFFCSLLYVSNQEQSWEAKYTVTKSDVSPEDDYYRFKHDVLEFKNSVYNDFSDSKKNPDTKKLVGDFLKEFKRLDSRGAYKIRSQCDIYKLFFNGELFRHLSSDELNTLAENGSIDKLIESGYTSNISRLCALDNMNRDNYAFELFINEFNKEKIKLEFYNEHSSGVLGKQSSSEFINSMNALRIDRLNAEVYYLEYDFPIKNDTVKILNEYISFIDSKVGIELVKIIDGVKQSFVSEIKSRNDSFQNSMKSDSSISENYSYEKENRKLAYLNKLTFLPVKHKFSTIVNFLEQDNKSYGWLLIFVNTLLGLLLGLSLSLFRGGESNENV